MKRFRKSIPSWFTAGNLVLGVFGIVFSAKSEFIGAASCIFLAAVLDFADGFVARLLKAESAFGREFDSLADAVTFGVCPALLLFYMTEPYVPGWTRYTAMFLALTAVIRLAKFNVDTRQTTKFIGLPTPAMALTIASFPFIIEYDQFNVGRFIFEPWFVVVFSLSLSFLMVSSLPLFALKFKSYQWQQNKLQYTFIILSIGFLALFQFLGIPFIVLAYIFLSMISKFAT